MASPQQHRASVAPAVMYAAVVVGLAVFFGAEAAAAGRAELWLVWALIAACAGTLAVAVLRGQMAGLAKPRWFNPLATLAFIFCIGFAALHASG